MRKLFSLALFITILDQATKWFFAQALSYGESWKVIPGFFDLTLVHNTGGAFGLLSQKTSIFIFLSLVTVVLLLIFYRKYADANTWIVWPFGLVLGGAIGNLIDRIRLGYVIDFLDFYFKQWHWPAFNVADSAICVGLFVLALFIGKVK